MNTIPLTRPFISPEVKERVLEVLASGFLTEGSVTREFEKTVAAYLGVQHVLAVCNCTVGLEIALRALGVGPGDEVIVPDFTYPATASAALLTGATVRLVDIDQRTMLMDYQAVEEAITPRTKVVMPVSIFGNPINYNRLAPLKKRCGLHIVEDAACALGSSFNGNMTGTLADLTVFSLHPRKFITTGEGGLVTTNNHDWARWIDSYKHFGMAPSATAASLAEFAMVGTNCKLSNLQAAVGLGQMTRVDELLRQRRSRAERYQELLAGVEGIAFPETSPLGSHSYQAFCIFVDQRDHIIQNLRQQGIEAQIGTYALHRQKAFQDHPNCMIPAKLPGSTQAFKHCLALPLYPGMTDKEQDHVIDKLKEVLASGGRTGRRH